MKYNVPYGLSDETTLYGVPYVNGNPSTGTMGSIPPAASIEYPQREIVAVIQYAYDHALIDYTGTPCASPDNADLKQLLKAIYGLSHQTALSGNVVFYVNSATGSDSNDGTQPNVGSGHGPFATIQKAVNVCGNFVPGTFGATISVAGGTYGPFVSPNWAHCNVSINGAGYSGAGRTYITNNAPETACCIVTGANTYNIRNLAVGNTGTGESCYLILANNYSTVSIDNIWSEGSNASSYCFSAFIGNLYVYNLHLNANNGAGIFLCAGSGANLDLHQAVITFEKALSYPIFAWSHILGNIGVTAGGYTCQFVGTGYATGMRYQSDYNAIINVNGMGPNFFPGTAPGGVSTGGQYF